MTGPIASRREPTAYGREVGVVERAPRTVITQNEQSPATGHAHPRAPGSRGMCSNHQLCREMFGRRSLYLAFVWARAAEVRRVCAAACVHEKVRAHGGRPHRPRYLSAWLALVYACLALWGRARGVGGRRKAFTVPAWAGPRMPCLPQPQISPRQKRVRAHEVRGSMGVATRTSDPEAIPIVPPLQNRQGGWRPVTVVLEAAVCKFRSVMRPRAMHTTAWRMHVVRDHVPCGHVASPSLHRLVHTPRAAYL